MPAQAEDVIILGIESSCDDTAAAVVRGDRTILSNVVAGQDALHAAYGGIVPEIAARAHAEMLDIAVEHALAEGQLTLADIDGVAVTAGPGLIGGVMSGVMMAQGLARGANVPLRGINHLAGHALTPRLTDGVAFPYVMLLISGGHCQFLLVDGPTTFTRLGGTIDDAPGEAFDKTARLLGLAQPGGPSVEREAVDGDATRVPLPRPLLDRSGCDMSFSGLKTAVLRARDAAVQEHGGLRRQDRRNICAAFQQAVTDVLVEKARRALAHAMDRDVPTRTFAVAGGVAANLAVRSGLETICQERDMAFVAPPLALCTDNAAMIAWTGLELARIGDPGLVPLVSRPRWPLDTRQPALLGAGKKGPKA